MAQNKCPVFTIKAHNMLWTKGPSCTLYRVVLQEVLLTLNSRGMELSGGILRLTPTSNVRAIKTHEWLHTCYPSPSRLSLGGVFFSWAFLRQRWWGWEQCLVERGRAFQGYQGLQELEERHREMCSTSMCPSWMYPRMQEDFWWGELVCLLEGLNNNHHSLGGYTLGIQAVEPLTL